MGKRGISTITGVQRHSKASLLNQSLHFGFILSQDTSNYPSHIRERSSCHIRRQGGQDMPTERVDKRRTCLPSEHM